MRDDELCVSTLDATTGHEAEENLAERRALNQKEVLAMVPLLLGLSSFVVHELEFF